MIFLDSLLSLSCRRFSRHVAMGVTPLEGGIYGKLQFWAHWVICPFCRRYWKELTEISALQRAHSALKHHPAVRLSEIKQRLKKKLVQRPA